MPKSYRDMLGKTMKSLSAATEKDPALVIIPSRKQLEDRLTDDQLTAMGKQSIFDEALSVVKNMTTEQLQQFVSPEPPLRGETTHGLSVEWINWYGAKNKCRTWKTIREGKRRLRQNKHLYVNQ